MCASAKGRKEQERWESAKQLCIEGRFEEVPADIYFRFYRTMKEIYKDHMQKPEDAVGTTGVWYWGEAGVGKSREARQVYPNSYMKMANRWWDGYQNEKTVILDDLDPKHSGLGHHLKIWGDRYAFIAEVKGGALYIRPDWIVVTSQYPPEDIWPDEPETVAAIGRRFQVKHFN